MTYNLRWGVVALLVVCGCGSRESPSTPLEPTVAEVTEAASAAGQYTYTFGPSGLPSSVGNGSVSYTITTTGSTLNAGADVYRLDALGRTTAIDDLTFVYGADSQLSRATRGAQTVSYLYDEDGQRILKTTNGTPTEAYVDGNVVTATELDEPVRIAGKVVGVLRNAKLSLAATDSRGTVQADTNGTPHIASPFGARTVHPDVAGIVDYTDKSFDADVGATRMGVRDYDARIARFLQPDPTFLDHPEKCVQSPSECNLYGYALGRPLDYVDPRGEGGIAVSFDQGLIPHAGIVLYDDKTGKASWVEFNPGDGRAAWKAVGRVDIRENIGKIEKSADGTPTIESLTKVMAEVVGHQGANGAFGVIVPEADADKAMAFAKSQSASPPGYNAIAAAPHAENCATFVGSVLRAAGVSETRGIFPSVLTWNLTETHSSFTQERGTIRSIDPPLPHGFDSRWAQ